MQNKSRKDCFWGIHSDFHAHPDYGAIIGATINEKDIRAICENIKPDFIQIDCKGHPGYASYPSKIGNAMPNISCDVLKLWRQITKEYGILLYMHISGVQDGKYCAEHPNEATMLSDKSLCNSVRLDSNYLDKCFIPQVCELVEKYDIDGIWIDGDCWSVLCDYHEETLKNFEKKLGITLNGYFPTKKGDLYFDEFLEFTRNAYREYLNYYVDKIHEKYPQLEICVNWAFSDHMPEPICSNVDFLSGDLDPGRCVYSSRYAGRMLAMHNKPWDLMAWGFRFNVYNTPITPPKHPVQLMQEAASVIALGGSFQNDVLQFSDGSHDIDRILQTIPLANFIRERRDYCHNGKIIPQAIMLVPSYDRYKEMTKPFTREGREKFYGLTALLCDSGESLSIVNESQLKNNIKSYPLIIIPELYCGIDNSTLELLRDYVLEGGSLMITGTKSVKFFEKANFPYKTEDYCEYPYTPGWSFGSTGYIKRSFPNGMPSYISVDNPNYGVTVGALTVKSTNENSAVIAKLHPSLQDKQGRPFAIVTPYGKGKLGIIGTNVGSQYNDCSQYQYRDIIRKMTSLLYDPIAKIESANGIAEIVCLSVKGELMLQILNINGNHRDFSVSTEPTLPALENVIISLRGDYNVENIILQPENTLVEFYKQENRTCFKIPRIDIHSIAHICIKK